MVLLDISIPKINGHEVLSTMKRDDYLKKIPVIVLTTSDAGKDIQKAYNNYANCYIIKPTDISKLMDAVIEIENFWLKLASIPTN